jgi:hypothetical protein
MFDQYLYKVSADDIAWNRSFLWRWGFMFWYFHLWCCMYLSTNVSVERAASIFRLA